jgi:hypothetical protein
MRLVGIPWIALLILSGCVSDSEKSGTRIRTLDACSGEAAKQAAYDTTGVILFASQDSLQARFTAAWGCGSGHSEKNSLADDSTLKVVYVRKPGPVAGCVCEGPVTLTANSTDHDLRMITRVDFNGLMITLKQDSTAGE